MNYKRLQRVLKNVMYDDKMEVARYIATVDAEGADAFAWETVYTDIPCKYAQDSTGTLGGRTDGAFIDANTEQVNCSPSLDIQLNDVLKIQKNGRLNRLYVTKVFTYPTHMELIVTYRKEG